MSRKDNTWSQVGKYSSMAFALPACIVVGYLAGMALDRWLGTTYLTIVLVMLGFVAGLVQVIRALTRDLDRGR